MAGEIWMRLQSAIGADNVTANSIRLFFRAAARKKRATALTAIEEAQANKEEGRRPRFGYLTSHTQTALKDEVREQYNSLPKDNDTELLIEEAFDLQFKGKHQYPKTRGKGSDNEASEPEANMPSIPPGGGAFSILQMLND